MMHPNHKIHTRLQLVKRLLNTSNCELIMKCILSESHDLVTNGGGSGPAHVSSNSVGFNAKLGNKNILKVSLKFSWLNETVVKFN